MTFNLECVFSVIMAEILALTNNSETKPTTVQVTPLFRTLDYVDYKLETLTLDFTLPRLRKWMSHFTLLAEVANLNNRPQCEQGLFVLMHLDETLMLRIERFIDNSTTLLGENGYIELIRSEFFRHVHALDLLRAVQEHKRSKGEHMVDFAIEHHGLFVEASELSNETSFAWFVATLDTAMNSAIFSEILRRAWPVTTLDQVIDVCWEAEHKSANRVSNGRFRSCMGCFKHHPRGHCPHRRATCVKCHRRGHIATACGKRWTGDD